MLKLAFGAIVVAVLIACHNHSDRVSPARAPMAKSATALAKGTWQTRPSLQHARAAHAIVSTAEHIYAVAGTDQEGVPVLPVERFDGAAWTVITTLPGDGLNAPAAATLGQKLYVLGGFNTTTNVATDQVLIYDIASATWQLGKPLPRPRGGHAALVLAQRLHAMGGGNSQSTLADHSRYDPATDTWTELAPLPRAKGSPAALVHRGKIYVLGGRSGDQDFGEVDIYDPANDTWTPGGSIEARGSAGAVEYCGEIHLFGGEAQARQACLDEVLHLDGALGKWHVLTPMPHVRNFARATLYRGDVYVVGGSLSVERGHAARGSTVVESFHRACVAR